MKPELVRQYFVTLRDSKETYFTTDVDFASNVKNSRGHPLVYFRLELFFNRNRIRIDLRLVDNLILGYEPRDGDILQMDDLGDISSKSEDEIVKELCEKITALEQRWCEIYAGFRNEIDLKYELLRGYVSREDNGNPS